LSYTSALKTIFIIQRK